MLEPRETDLPALFLVLVVLPLLAYILLGKWSEASRKKERISLLAQLAAEEALRAEAMAAASVIPLVPSSKKGIHECARCFAPATTRCSQCKSIRYCSGKCQIIHWREVHKQECQLLETSSGCSSPKLSIAEESICESVLLDGNMNSHCFGFNIKQPVHERTPFHETIHHSLRTDASAPVACTTVDTSGVSVMERRSIDKRISRKSNKEVSRRDDGAILGSSEETFKNKIKRSASSKTFPSKEAHMRHKIRNGDSVFSEEEIPKIHNVNIPGGFSNGEHKRSTTNDGHNLQSKPESVFDSITDFGESSSSNSAKNGTNLCGIEMDLLLDRQNLAGEGLTSNDEKVELNCSSEMILMKRTIKTRSGSYSPGSKMYKSPKLMMKASREQSCSDLERKKQNADGSIATMRNTVAAQGSNGVASMGIMKMIGLRKSSKLDRKEIPQVFGDRRKKLKMLFPYEEYVKFFQCEFSGLTPRGLVNCGNSCYANAVLQCLTCTKPLTIYLHSRSHSRTCCVKDWCLMCELEQHVTMLRESGGPLSPSRILSHMRSINCQIGDGSQEDAHEFLRLLVTSMQSICLEGLGGEEVVDPRLQETTFIQHTFGGRLRSKVKCLRCHHESERYENIMDLTLEIFGWVESLEDALTQFTTPEDLDGENMYRCGRCAAYVRARKQLSIHEAPNVLTIVLKRFQEGSYGKINKCITFPDMLDMIPFMTGTVDIPPLYLLYAVVVHLDTLNASFSGHYISYVKDLQGNWFRIDDTEVHPVPMSQVMLEGAYILFYMRSCPRPTITSTAKATQHQASGFANHWTSKSHKSSRPGQSKSSCHFVGPEASSDLRPESTMGFTNHTLNGILRSANRNRPPTVETYAESRSIDFSDATSSDWSIFTSSDEASFTTESTRDSFSTVDYADACNIDPISSIFNNLYVPEYSSHKHVSCSMFSRSKPQTRFVLEGKSLVLDSYPSTQPLDRVEKVENLKKVSISSIEAFHSDSNFGIHVKCGSNSKDGICRRTSGHCKLQFLGIPTD
ncbi:ubiquitin carboxyl-terminal hydrolase 15 isoform X2 [Cornus florida]|uniref:ubiquitin carboxyl-terminal hydrolase 15 isoform X2 n=1 Tax=Cornus florida TaxID=4283 RepID=UPI00289BD57A|nr:ubiquitin carboxyl-terminal hydrolase 15 isoform X2 [Cornus florida]